MIQKVKIFFKKLNFINPKTTTILIYDIEGSNVLVQTIIKNNNYGVLPARHEYYYITPKIFYLMLKFILSNCNFQNVTLTGKIYRVYLKACLEIINPHFVLTFIDNDPVFYWLSRNYIKSSFYAIQNGVRFTKNSCEIFLERSLYSRPVDLPNLLCFGENDIENSQKSGAHVDKYHAVGALIGGYYKYQHVNHSSEKKYDLCLVSQYRDSIFILNESADYKKALTRLNEFLKKFLIKHPVCFCITLVSNTEKEIAFFKDIFEDRTIFIVPEADNIFSTYAAMDTSEVIITFYSTAALEAFGWGKKVLFCNFSEDNLFDFTFEGVFSINTVDYDLFERKVTNLLSLDEEKFSKMTEKERKYLMNYNPQIPAHKYISDIIYSTA